MITETQRLEKLIKEQAKQIDALKKAVIVMQRKLIMVGKKTDRTYHTGRKNSNDITTLSGILGKNK